MVGLQYHNKEVNMKNSNHWFIDAKYGLMIHFGLYSLLGGEYKNYKMQSYCEWIQSYARIPICEYEKLLKKCFYSDWKFKWNRRYNYYS